MRRLCSIAGGRSRSYAERFPSLLDPLPGLHDEHQQHSPPPSTPPLPLTEVTTLPNGVRIASQDIPGPTCCVGVTVAAGSVNETPSSAGTAYMLERLAFQETQHRGLGEIARSVEATTGGRLGAEAGREAAGEDPPPDDDAPPEDADLEYSAAALLLVRDTMVAPRLAVLDGPAVDAGEPPSASSRLGGREPKLLRRRRPTIEERIHRVALKESRKRTFLRYRHGPRGEGLFFVRPLVSPSLRAPAR